jgi:anti-sigma factor (TIGR02949 family)
MLTCRDVIDLLAEYLEESLRPESVAEFEQHLQDCPPCLAYLRTYRRTRTLAAEASQVEMPPELKARLRALLFGRLGSGPS